MSGRSAEDSRVMHPLSTELTGRISPAGPLAVRLQICETRTKLPVTSTPPEGDTHYRICDDP
jgi:hypothetical protein